MAFIAIHSRTPADPEGIVWTHSKRFSCFDPGNILLRAEDNPIGLAVLQDEEMSGTTPARTSDMLDRAGARVLRKDDKRITQPLWPGPVCPRWKSSNAMMEGPLGPRVRCGLIDV
jgi:hypothetical protein